MPDEKHAYEPVENPPIPSYEEATSSAPPTRRGPNEVSDDAERQGLLAPDTRTQSEGRRRNAYYHPPSVQSVDDGESELGSPVRESEEEDLRQTMEEMDILDPEAIEEGRARRGRGRGRGLGAAKRWYGSLKFPRWRVRIPWPDMTYIRQRMPTIPDEYRPGWSIIARLCGLFVIIALVYILVVSEVVPMGSGFGTPFNPEWVRQTALQSTEAWRIEKNLEYITSYDHLAGTEGSYVLGQWIEGKFKDAGLDTYTHDEYWAYMNYAQKGGRRVAIVDPPEKAWVAKLEESSVFNPPKAQTSAFHALSASGNVTGPLIYVNYCHKTDFKRLWDSEVDVQGAIALCRYHGTQPDLAMKIRSAQDAGVAGVLVYSDPADDGFKKGNPWPDGKWRPGESVQRGSVAQTNMIMGDVLTPGTASTKKAGRISKDKNPALPHIPSLPLSWKDAQKLLQSLKGIGEELPAEWTGGVPDVGEKWFSGHPAKSPKVNLQNTQDEVEQQRVTNVFGTLTGIEDPARKIIIGNHRDSWCFGAADPGSGTAVMLEVARVLGELRTTGWQPLRTIEFASWDAGAYNRIGSTEHVEANVASLRDSAIAYLNVDVAVSGPKLRANGSPIFAHAWTHILGLLSDPKENVTLKDIWERDGARIGHLGAGSDYVAFANIAGTSSFDFRFAAAADDGALDPMAGSCFATRDWMAKYIDPGYAYHTLHAQLLLLLILELAQEPIMPLKLDVFAHALQVEAQKLIDFTETKATVGYDIAIFRPLVDALAGLKARGEALSRWETAWGNQVYGAGGFETQGVTLQRVAHNARLARFETDLLDLPRGEAGGKEGRKEGEGNGRDALPNRTQFKHSLFAPSLENGLEGVVFPRAREAIERQDWVAAKEALQRTADALEFASERLVT
ncbi:Zn-dependent exopeptidase [Dothidotthia symphoricarpi CBS 119687]|uniref:Zn-dependent exopeptidase n=1 Tax=Dothidotthia symphoricarpi CBS 119687 TaxID=1392245 RepID=A0A6A6AP75_9PLEO|nr:Zn-dependent exopeptidase [Dothidotthia symphoricarpi CBS 119687]KAF2133336.1 Zn-dependent exopeptidase [Dothidotthia symphoricarpi CBS 119687]